MAASWDLPSCPHLHRCRGEHAQRRKTHRENSLWNCMKNSIVPLWYLFPEDLLPAISGYRRIWPDKPLAEGEEILTDQRSAVQTPEY